MTVIVGYQPWTNSPSCPYCKGNYGAVEDDGRETYLYRCWCGAKARIAKDDPDLLAVLRRAK